MDGDPEQAYRQAMALIESHRLVYAEAARQRFKVNFGTPVCDTCDGLRAGPDVAATCFQTRQCLYRSLKKTEVVGRHEDIVTYLSKKTP